MKKLLTICFLITIAFTSQAQEGKPTKEETIAFINRTINECKGFKLPYYMGKLESASFTENKLTYKTTTSLTSGKKNCDREEIYEDIFWDKLKVENIKFENNEDGASYYEINFSQNMSHSDITENCVFIENHSKTNILSNMYVFIPVQKKESIKKAFLRLSEIGKEENKDPFED
jgi:hypothetical protein